MSVVTAINHFEGIVPNIFIDCWNSYKNLLWKLYHISMLAWKIHVFEVDWGDLSVQILGVEDDIPTGVQRGHAGQAGVAASEVGDDHVAITTVEVPLEQDKIIVAILMNFVVVNFIRCSVTVGVAGFIVAIHVDRNRGVTDGD